MTESAGEEGNEGRRRKKEGRRRKEDAWRGRKMEGGGRGCRQQKKEEGERKYAEEACRGCTVHEGKCRGCMQRRPAKDAGSMHKGIHMYDHDGTHSGGGKTRKEEERGGVRKA